MARHRDISNTHALLDGEGWHIVKSNSQIPKKNHIATKRDKRHCIYYNKINTHCNKLKCVCMGAYDCASYIDFTRKK